MSDYHYPVDGRYDGLMPSRIKLPGKHASAEGLQDDDFNLVDSAPEALEVLLGLATNHRLELISETDEGSSHVKRKVKWLEEFDAQNRSIARFRVWRERSTHPPYRRELGWERFAIDDGRLLDREVRLTRRKSLAWLH